MKAKKMESQAEHHENFIHYARSIRNKIQLKQPIAFFYYTDSYNLRY